MMRDHAIADVKAAPAVRAGAAGACVAASVVVRWLSAFSRCTLA